MKYLIKYLDGNRHIMMKEVVESNLDIAHVLKHTGWRAVESRQKLKIALIKKNIPVKPSEARYEIVGGETLVYDRIDDSEEVVEIHVCKPVRFPFLRKARRTLEMD